MSDTPIIDATIKAAAHALGYEPSSTQLVASRMSYSDWETITIAALRAALPWDLPAERLEAMARGAFRVGDDIPQGYLRAVLAAYRADPIMRELYPEKY